MINIINQISTEHIIYAILGLILFIIILLIWNIRLEIKAKRLMRGKAGNSLEDSFVSMQRDITDLDDFRKQMVGYLKMVELRLKRSVQGVENINFNAFQGAESGGKSFATAFINENGDGVIISSLHARERVSIFTKKIKGFKSDVELSEEEQDALSKAKISVGK